MKRAADIDISKIDKSSDEFQNALNLLQFTRQSVFLTGKAGTGKSTFLQYFTHTTKKKYVVLAPTGIAAVNAGGQTLHSFFHLPFKPMLPSDPEVSTTENLRKRMKYTANFVKMLKRLDVIIIDEVSMVRADTIDFIDRLLRTYCGKPNLPFGGKQMLLVGDVFQLEPVITGDMFDALSHEYTEGMYFFNAHVFRQMSLVSIELTKSYRQNDLDFISMLDRIRLGRPAPEDLAMLNARVVADDDKDGDFTMTLATKRDIVSSINEAHLAALPSKLRTFEGVVKGDFPDNSLPTDKLLELKLDAQVVFVKNDTDHRWVNGTIGKIADFGSDQICVQLENGDKVNVEPEVWTNVKYHYDEKKREIEEIELGSFAQYPLKLAWALTIHKSQGLTFDRVIIDVGSGAFSGGQTYVALSRCRTLEGIRLRSAIRPRDIFVNPRVERFSGEFNNDLLVKEAMRGAKADGCYRDAAECFDRKDMAGAVDSFIKAIRLRNDLEFPGVARLIRTKLQVIHRQDARIAELEATVARQEEVLLRVACEYISMGNMCLAEGMDAEAAVRNFDKALSMMPESYDAWYGKGRACGAMGDIDSAVEAFTRASRIQPKDYAALYELGMLMMSAQDMALALEYLLHACQRNAKVAKVHLALAEAYEKIGDEAESLHHRRIAKTLQGQKGGRNQKK